MRAASPRIMLSRRAGERHCRIICPSHFVPPPLVHRDPPLAPSLLRSVGADPPLGRSLPGLRVTPPRSVAPSVSSVIHHAISNQRVPPVPPGWREQGRRRLLPPPLPLSTRRPPLPRMRICEALRARPPAVCANDAGSAAVCCRLAASAGSGPPPRSVLYLWTRADPPFARSLCQMSVNRELHVTVTK